MTPIAKFSLSAQPAAAEEKIYPHLLICAKVTNVVVLCRYHLKLDAQCHMAEFIPHLGRLIIMGCSRHGENIENMRC